jgi:gluconolactonase
MSSVRVLATDLEFPEGPVVMPDGSVVLVEIRGRRLTRVWPDGRKEVVAEIPGGPNGAAIGPDGKCYICNNGGFSWIPSRGTMMPGPPSPAEYIGGSIQRIDLSSGKVETLFDKCGEHPLKGPNDLVFDRQGGLWFTDLGKRRARDMDVGAVYYMKPGAAELTEQVFGMLPANGIGLSPDENTVYVAETPTARLWAFDLSAPGEVKPRDVIYRGERGKPIAGLGGYQMFDFARGGSLRQYLRCDAGLGLHFGHRARWQHRRAGADRRPRHHQHRVRRPRTQDRLHHAVRQGRTDRDGLGAARPAAEFSQQVIGIIHGVA